MSRVLAELLGAEELAFNRAILELESFSDKPGVDIKIGLEIAKTVTQKYRELGLDPTDTTQDELYAGLQQLVGKHDEFLAKAYGVKSLTKTSDVLPKVVKALQKFDLPKSCFALKHTSTRKILKSMPPKKVMKQLGYRSIDSMLKRENVDELLIGARIIETKDWTNKLVKRYRRLTPQDFETRNIVITLLDEKRWGKSLQEHALAAHSHVLDTREVGVVAILPLPMAEMSGVCLATTLLGLRATDDIRYFSAVLKHSQVRTEFGAKIVTMLKAASGGAVTMGGQTVDWRLVMRYFGSSSQSDHPSVFEPHVQSDDLKWVKAEEVLYKLEPALKFWHDIDFVGSGKDGSVVSLNLLDNVINFSNHIDFRARTFNHMRSSLWNEILLRYMGQKKLNQQIIAGLESDQITPMIGEEFSEI